MASISDPAQSADSSAALVAFTAIANPGPASRLRFSVNPRNTFSARPIRPAVTVSVVDAFDNPTGSAATVSVALGAHSGTGVLSGTTRVDAAGGVATFVDLSIDQAGTRYTLGASATGLTGATSAAFDVVTPGPGEISFLRGLPSGGNYSEIYVMNPDGSGQVNLTKNPAIYYYALVWSPDGTRIAFVTDRDGNPDIYVMNADGSGMVNLSNNPAVDGEPAWSPDGSRIAFYSNRSGNGEIYVMNADGSGQVKLTNNPAAWNGNPAWSPDGSKIAFSSGRDGNPEIYVMNADGSGQVNLTNNPAYDGLGSYGYGIAWSPDGSKIAFPSDREGNFKIYAMNADGSGVSRLTNGTLSDRSPIWSPDGTKIAFVRVSGCRRCIPPRDIYVMNADGSGQVKLTNNPAPNDSPAWSPDGSRVAFFSGRDGNYEIYVMNADGSGAINLTNNPGSDVMPTWKPR
jgi:Tol biopolymer transport system component